MGPVFKTQRLVEEPYFVNCQQAGSWFCYAMETGWTLYTQAFFERKAGVVLL